MAAGFKNGFWSRSNGRDAALRYPRRHIRAFDSSAVSTIQRF
jgi:hypothetical protein